MRSHALIAMLIWGACASAEPAACAIDTSLLSNQELLEYRREQLARVEAQASTAEKKNSYFCTVYYTPRETGFTAERGFDPTPATAPGLGNREYPISFLRVVKVEGFGRLIKPVNGCAYLQYVGRGIYRYSHGPLGSDGEPLVAKQSCAVARENTAFARGSKIIIVSPTLQEVMGSSRWRISDFGHGLHPRQIDLYWGEDEPLGASNRERARPAGCRLEYIFDATVTPPKEKRR